MSRPLQDEKQLCADLTSYINSQKTLAKQKKIIATTNSAAAAEAAALKKGSKKKRKAGAGSIWLSLKGGFSALTSTAKAAGKNATFRQNLQATKDARREQLAAAAAVAEEETPVEVEGEEVEEAEEQEEEEVTPVAEAEDAEVAPIGSTFADLVLKNGGRQDDTSASGLNDEDPTKCILRLKSSHCVRELRDKTKFAPSASVQKKINNEKDPAKAKKLKRAAQRKIARRLKRGTQRSTTCILGTQKSVNYFKTNIIQVIKKEVVPYMEKKLTAPPAIGNTPFSDVAPLQPAKSAAAAEASPEKSGGKKGDAQQQGGDKNKGGKQANNNNASPSGKTKSQQGNDGGKKGGNNNNNAKKGGGGGGGKGGKGKKK